MKYWLMIAVVATKKALLDDGCDKVLDVGTKVLDVVLDVNDCDSDEALLDCGSKVLDEVLDDDCCGNIVEKTTNAIDKQS